MSPEYVFLLCLTCAVCNTSSTSHLEVERYSRDSGNMSNLANSSEGIPCSHYKELHPYKEKTTLDKQCNITFTPSSKQYFTYKVLKFKYRFVRFHLQFLNLSSDSEIHYTRCVIQPMEWIWTFRGVGGNYGGRQYLDWPPDYDTMSMGMLSTYTSPPLRMNLTVQGKCDIVIGAKNTTMRLAMAFANFTGDLAKTKDEYNYSYWCYKERIFVQNNFLFQLCLHVICPIETIGYRCCKHTYDVSIHDFITSCPGYFYVFGGVWWVCPFVIGSVLYLYLGLILLSFLSVIYQHLPPITRECTEITENKSSKSQSSKIKWIHNNTVTVFSMFVMPIRKCCEIHPNTTSRLLRCLVAVLSITIIFINVSVNARQNREYIIQSVKQGAPMNFLSMIAGYNLSKENFLIFLGGPYIALAVYLVCFIALICLPKNLADFLTIGLPEKTNNPMSVLTVDLKLREFFGSRRILSNRNDGYRKIQKTLVANIFCLLNPHFWKFAFSVQINRFKIIAIRITGNRPVRDFIIVLVILLPYLAFCFIEIAFTVLCCGFPTIFVIGLIYRSYCRNIYDWLSRKGIVGLVAMVIIMPGCLVVLTYTVYMFSIIFLDSFIFLSRVVIFTYTGLFANPSYTEGYLVFSITVAMYIYDSIHSINETYEQVFNQTKKVCKRLSKRMEDQEKLYRKDIEGAGIRLELYLFVVDSHKPKRVEILKALVKIATIFLCLYISIGILTQFDGFQQLSVVTQTATTTFICLVPKIFARMCSLNERRQILRTREKLHVLVDNFLIFKGIEYKVDNSINENNADMEQILSGPSFELL